MKKLGILLMAMVLVVGMSAMVLGATGESNVKEGNLTDGNVSDTIGVNLNIGKYAVVDVDTSSDFDLTATEPMPDARSAANDTKEISIKANTDITVTVRENLSKVVGDAVGANYISSLGGEDAYGASFGAFLGNTTNVNEGEFDEETRDVWDIDEVNQGRRFIYYSTGSLSNEWNDGSFTGYIHFNMVWYDDWEVIDAGTYSGDVEVIVAAQ